MPLIGITGGIATGKSSVSQMMRELGATVISADEAAHEVLEPGTPEYRAIVAEFGQEIVKADGKIERARLGEIVFADPVRRRKLEEITHPAIVRLLTQQVEAVRKARGDDAAIVVEVPLLFEAGMQDRFDEIVVLTASEATQVKRLMAHRKLTENEARSRIAAQMPLSEKAARADHVIPNDGDLEMLSQMVGEIWQKISI